MIIMSSVTLLSQRNMRRKLVTEEALMIIPRSVLIIALSVLLLLQTPPLPRNTTTTNTETSVASLTHRHITWSLYVYGIAGDSRLRQCAP